MTKNSRAGTARNRITPPEEKRCHALALGLLTRVHELSAAGDINGLTALYDMALSLKGKN